MPRRLIVAPLLLAAALGAGETPSVWWISATALSAATAADSASSYGRAEANPLLGARFGPRALVIKLSVSGAGLYLQHRLLSRSHSPRRRAWYAAAAINLAASSALALIARRNLRIR